jgi:hypothetical protein
MASLKRFEQAERRCHGLYYTAMRADLAYTRAVKRAFGRSATRWTVKQAEQMTAPAVRRAYRRKVAVDAARARACAVMRRR